MKFMFGLQHTLTCKPWKTLSNPCNKERGIYVVNEVLLASSLLHPLFLRLSVCVVYSCDFIIVHLSNYCVVRMLHEHVYENISIFIMWVYNASWSNSLGQGWSYGLVHCPGGNATESIWKDVASSGGISSWITLKPQHTNPNPNTLANELWCIDFLTPLTPLMIPHRLPDFLESLISLKNWCSIHARWFKSSLKHSIRFCGIFSKFKTEFYCISFF